jgi:hypothetical protein
MTEHEWLACGDLAGMLEYLAAAGYEGRYWRSPWPGMRKLLLLGCGCCRRGWHLLTDERSRWAVETTEGYADGEADEEELEEASAAAQEVIKEASRRDPDGYYRVIWREPALAYAHAAAHVGWHDDEYTYGYGTCEARRAGGRRPPRGGPPRRPSCATSSATRSAAWASSRPG